MKKVMIVINYMIKGIHGPPGPKNFLKTFIFSLNFIQLHSVSISLREVYE